MVRLSYRYEIRSALTFPLAASLAEGSFTGIVAAKYFGASPTLIALITAAPMFGNIAALIWAELAKTRRKVAMVNLLQLGIILLIAAVALTAKLPQQWGGWIFGLIIILVRLLASGIPTIRSEIWRCNYPRHIRAQIIGRISIVSTSVLAFTTMLGSHWLDQNPNAFVYLYPAAAILGAIGIYQFSNIRVREEGKTLRRLQRVYAPVPEEISQTDEISVQNYQPPQNRKGLRAFFADSLDVLRSDKTFRIYQRCQMLTGFSFMLFGPSLVLMVSKEMTDQKRDYLLATFILTIIPLLVMILSTQFWAPIFDRLHITSFRIAQTSVSFIAMLILSVGALTNQLWIIAIAQILVGVSNAGGNLAWNLGHNAFAPPDKAATYMGVHVMLTGLRGCIAPFLGAWLYQIPLIGRGVFLIAAAISLSALAGFFQMWRHRNDTTTPSSNPTSSSPNH
jgi:hypothetical protein